MSMRRIEPGPGQESVWDYPRPPRLEPVEKRIEVYFGGVKIADTRGAFRVLETSHPPVYYLPPSDVRMEHLKPSPRRSTHCEWKGAARYYDVEVEGRRAQAVAWAYPQPELRFESLRDHLAVYPGEMEARFVGGERVTAQEGDFYGGWITRDVVGPFMGGAGTWGW